MREAVDCRWLMKIFVGIKDNIKIICHEHIVDVIQWTK